MLDRVARFTGLSAPPPAERMALDGFKSKSANGRPMGTAGFVTMAEEKLGRRLTPRKLGRKRKEGGAMLVI